MPRVTCINVELPFMKPDRCVDCPLLGIIPVEQRDGYKSQQTRVCMGKWAALSERLSKARASVPRSGGHRLIRPCDEYWDIWQDDGRKVTVGKDNWMRYRLPYEKQQQVVIDFDWNRRGRKRRR